MSSLVTVDSSAAGHGCTKCLLVSFNRQYTEQLRCKRAVEISPPALHRQVRPAARVSTVGVDTAAVVNLHIVTRAGLQLRRSCRSCVTALKRFLRTRNYRPIVLQRVSSI